MSPDKIRDLLQDACPELVWVINGDRVRAEGTNLHASATSGAGGWYALWLGRASFETSRVGSDPVGLRLEVWRRLTKGEIRALPGARLLDARMRAERAQSNVATQIARERDARQALTFCEAALADALATAAAAEAALVRATAHAAKVGA